MSIERAPTRDLFALSAERDALEAERARAREAARLADPHRYRWTFGLSGWLPSSAEDDFVLA